MDQRGARNRNWKGGVSAEAYRYTKRFRVKYPEKARAHDKVRRAIEAGLLVRMPCEACGAERAHAHHEDYSAPLDVRWICQKCHSGVHAGSLRVESPRTPFEWRGRVRK
jgi:ribosomal protein S27AE